MGAGFYTHLNWPLVACWICGGVIWLGARTGWEDTRRWLLPFVVTFIVLTVPIGYAILDGRYGGYYGSLWSLGRKGYDTHRQWPVLWDYLSSLMGFRIVVLEGSKTIWSGSLNPVVGSLFWVGVLAFLGGGLRRRWLAAVLTTLILMAPAVLSWDFEPFRMVQCWFPMYLLAGIGFVNLAERLPGRFLGLFCVGLLMVSTVFDVHKIMNDYGSSWKNVSTWKGLFKSKEYKRAFLILNDKARQEGLGLIFTEFSPKPFDQTLSVAVYAFNAARNNRLIPVDARWGAVITSRGYGPFLRREFPGALKYELSEDVNVPGQGLLLTAFPVSRAEFPRMWTWMNAVRDLNGFREDVLLFRSRENIRRLIEDLNHAETGYRGDRFLQSYFWEQIGLLYDSQWYSSHTRAGIKPSPPTRPIKALDAWSRSVSLGWPAGHLFLGMGVLRHEIGDEAGAARDFQMAKKAETEF
jgi:hypothetical protein